jgi:hypothetical protein
VTALGLGAEATAAATAACTPKCPYFDYQGQLYGQTDPSFESVVSLTGGVNNTRYFFSGMYKQEAGVINNTGARRQSLRANLDQAIGSKITVSLGANLLRSFSQRGISNNDNALSSPIYSFGYTPAIVDLRQKDASGRFILNPFPATKSTSNPFQTMETMLNNEDVYRQIFSSRVNFAALSTGSNNLNFSLQAGAILQRELPHAPYNCSSSVLARCRAGSSRHDHRGTAPTCSRTSAREHGTTPRSPG